MRVGGLGRNWVELEWALDPNEHLPEESLVVTVEVSDAGEGRMMGGEEGQPSSRTNVRVATDRR